jgi:hypothetical protein
MFWEYSFQMPEVSRSSDNGAIEKVSVSYNLPKGYEWREELPGVGSYCEGFGYYSGYQFTESPGYDIIRMNFTAQPSTDLPGRDSRKAGDDVWSIHYMTYERDLRLHPKYKTFWNYNLAAKKGTDTKPSWSETVEDITIPDADKDKFRWAADTNEIPEGWGVIQKRKYTFDSYKDFTVTATGTSYFKDFASAKSGGAGEIMPAHLGLPSIAIPGCLMTLQCWMVEDINISGDGDLFTVQISLQYNQDGWENTEIYS